MRKLRGSAQSAKSRETYGGKREGKQGGQRNTERLERSGYRAERGTGGELVRAVSEGKGARGTKCEQEAGLTHRGLRGQRGHGGRAGVRAGTHAGVSRHSSSNSRGRGHWGGAGVGARAAGSGPIHGGGGRRGVRAVARGDRHQLRHAASTPGARAATIDVIGDATTAPTTPCASAVSWVLVSDQAWDTPINHIPPQRANFFLRECTYVLLVSFLRRCHMHGTEECMQGPGRVSACVHRVGGGCRQPYLVPCGCGIQARRGTPPG